MDDLTKLMDSVELQDFLSGTIPSDASRGYVTSVGILDIVRFGEYNKKYGEPQGDAALYAAAENILKYKAECRNMTCAARIGFPGSFRDYFAVVFEALEEDKSLDMMRLLKQELEGMEIPLKRKSQAPDNRYQHIEIDGSLFVYRSGQELKEGGLVKARHVLTALIDDLDDKSKRTGDIRLIRQI